MDLSFLFDTIAQRMFVFALISETFLLFQINKDNVLQISQSKFSFSIWLTSLKERKIKIYFHNTDMSCLILSVETLLYTMRITGKGCLLIVHILLIFLAHNKKQQWWHIRYSVESIKRNKLLRQSWASADKLLPKGQFKWAYRGGYWHSTW